MEKVKYLKFEQQDGTFTNKIPLALDSTQVDTSSIGIDNLKDTLETQQTEIQAANLEINSLNDVNGRLERKEATNKANLEAMLEYIPDGSPLGYYNTVATLIAANPASGTYIIQEDSHIYSWTKDAVTAIDLGLYRAEPDEEAKEKLNRFKMIYNAFPKVEDEDANITLNDTADSPLTLGFKASESTQGDLPIEYQEVEYIESTGTQYINTGYVPNQNTSVDIKFVKHSNTFVFGSRTSLSLNSFGLALLQDGFRSDYGSSNITYQRSFSEPIILNVDKNKVYVYNLLEITHEQQIFTSPGNLYLFGINNNGSPLYGSHSIYYFKIYDNGTLVRDMIPCYRKNDNVAGMYDTVNNVFYTNAGTEAFVVSNNTMPSPDYPQDIHVVKGDNEIIVRNKNWINNNNLDYIDSNVSSSYNQLSTISTGIRYKTTYPDGYPNVKFKVFDATSYKGKTVKLKSTFTAGGTISIIRMNEDCTDSSNEVSSNVSNTTLSYVIPNDLEDKNYIGFRLMCNVSTSNDVYFTNLIMTVDNDIEPYVPYLQQSYPLTLDNLEMCKINNYADEFFKNIPECEYYDSTLEVNKWYKYSRIGKIDLSTLTWTQQTTQAGYVLRYTTSITDIKYTSSNTQLGNGLAEKYIMHIGSGMSTAFNNIAIDTNAVRVSSIEPPTGLFYYELATPTKTLLSNTLQEQLDNLHYALSYKDQTNLNQENTELPFILSASAVKDMSDLGVRVATLESGV